MASRHSQRERGQVLVMITLSAILIFAILGLVVDIGWVHFRKNAAQTAADAAALAAVQAASISSSGSPICGANSVVCQAATACPSSISSPPANNLLAGCLYAKSNGFVASGSQNVTMAANTTSPPPSAPGATVKYWVNVSIAERQTELFSAILGNKYLTVGANATAAMLPSAGGGCVYVMDPSGSSVLASGSPSVQSGCGVYVNSSSSSAVFGSGTPTIKTTGGATTNIVGSGPGWSGWSIAPAPNVGVAAATDPFASMNPPTVGACTYSSPVVITTDTTLNPGTYCGGIITSGTETITLNPGLYIIKSGITESGSPTFNGSGVTLYFNTGGITGSGTGTFNISAPATGTYKGIAIYEDRSDSSAMALSGSTGNQINGAIYVPKASLVYSGYSGISGVATTIVAYDLTFSGTSYISTGATTAFGSSRGGVVGLVE
jgi:Flp pilus assembly protein TadG